MHATASVGAPRGVGLLGSSVVPGGFCASCAVAPRLRHRFSLLASVRVRPCPFVSVYVRSCLSARLVSVWCPSAP